MGVGDHDESDDNEGREYGDPSELLALPVPPARARPYMASPTRELAEEISRHLAQPKASLVGACAMAGVYYRTVKRWLAAEVTEETDPELADFQVIVVGAMERERVRDLLTLDIEFNALRGMASSKAGPLVNKHVHYHTNRFRRFYADDEAPSKVELTGKDGGPLKSLTLGAGLGKRTAAQIANDFLGVPVALQEAGRLKGEIDMSSADADEDDPGPVADDEP